MKTNLHLLMKSLRPLVVWINSLTAPKRLPTSFGLKTKMTFFILLIAAGVLFIYSYLDFQLVKKAQIDLYLDRNLYIAKQIDIGIPAQSLMDNLPRIRDEIEDWLLSRPGLLEVNVFLFSSKGWVPVTSDSKNENWTPLVLTNEQIRQLKKDEYLSSLQEVDGEKRLGVIVPLHSRGRIIGGVRVISSLDEAHSYLSKKKTWTFILTISSIFVIMMMLILLFRKLVGNPIQKLVVAMSRAEKGDLEAEVHIRSQDELAELGRHFNRMLKTIRESNEQNVQLLSKVSRFNEELTRKIEAATSELSKRNEELKVLNQALFESQRQLGLSEKFAALGQVTAMMAHQIGTPLNSISGYLQLMLQDGNLQLADENRLKIIESQLDRLADSIRKLLSFTIQPKPQFKPLGVNEVLEELIHLSEPWFLTRNVKFISLLSAGLPPVFGDFTLLQTLFLNLIANALDAMPSGGTLTIKTQETLSPPHSGNGGWLEISITDTGIGISEESKKKIFDPFFTTKGTGKGIGLGLTICEKIVKDHSGRLDVISEVGKGSTFFVLVPPFQGK